MDDLDRVAGLGLDLLAAVDDLVALADTDFDVARVDHTAVLAAVGTAVVGGTLGLVGLDHDTAVVAAGDADVAVSAEATGFAELSFWNTVVFQTRAHMLTGPPADFQAAMPPWM